MKLSIIIVNYNTTLNLRKCINSIVKNITELEYEIIVVDNYSSDKSILEVAKEYPRIKLFLLYENNGFGAGCNYGFKESSGEYILFLNPDTILESNLGIELIEFMEQEKNVGVCSVFFKGMKEEIQYFYNSFPNLWWEFLELTAYFHNKKIKKLSIKVIKESAKKQFMEIDWVIGACLCIRREVFELVNGFDESFFLYYEDTDLQKRIKNANYKVFLDTRINIRHEGKSSIDENESGDNVYFLNMHRSKLIYYRKHHSSIYVVLVRLINIIAYMLRLLIVPFKINSVNKIIAKYRKILKIIKIYSGSIQK